MVSKIEELITQYSPNSIHTSRLCDVAEIKRGVRVVRAMLKDRGEIPVYQNSLTPLGYNTESNYPANTTFVICAGAAGEIGYSSEPFWAADDCTCFSCGKELVSKYLFYFLLTQQNKIKSQVRKASVPRLSKSVLERLIIPLPPISVQEEIVCVLDSFTDLQNNLQQELNAREKQYAVYREKLLSFNDDIETERIDVVFKMRNGYTPSKNNDEFWTNGTIPWFRMEDIRENGRILSDSLQHISPKAVKGKGLFPANSIILATSATIGEHALLLHPSLSNQRFTNFFPKEIFEKRIDMKYVYYFMFIIDEWCKGHTLQGGFASVDMEGLSKYEFPIPPIDVQKRIVEELDVFESVIKNLNEELSLRRQQYEYYREHLLTF